MDLLAAAVARHPFIVVVTVVVALLLLAFAGADAIVGAAERPDPKGSR